MDVLIEAMGRLTDMDVHLRVVGESWVDERKLRERVVVLGLEQRVEFDTIIDQRGRPVAAESLLQ